MHNHDTGPDDLIDRYLCGQLRGEALTNFEVRMLEEAEFFAAVQEAGMMREEMRMAMESGGGEDQPQLHEPVVIESPSFGMWIRQPMSLVASVLLGISLLFAMIDRAPEYPENGFAVDSVVSFAPVRGDQNLVVLDAGVHLLQVDVGISLNEAVYQVELANAERSRVLVYRLAPDSNGIVRFVTPDNLSGDYVLTVTREGSADGADSLERYQIRFE